MAKVTPIKKAPVKSAPTKTPPAKPPAKVAKAVSPTRGEKYGVKDLAADVAARLPLVSLGTTQKVIEHAFAQIGEAFVAGKVVNIKDFGRFEVKHRPARQGRNPATGETISIDAKTVPGFRFAKALKDAALGG